jgi:hypothetical protein
MGHGKHLTRAANSMPHFFRLGCRTAPSKEKQIELLFFGDYTETMINIFFFNAIVSMKKMIF